MNLSSKAGAAGLSVASNIFLSLLKMTAGLVTGSVSVLSEGINSLVDLFASLIAFFSIRIAGHPADDEHPFGHGKAENISGAVEGVLIFIGAGIVIYQAIRKLMFGVTIQMVDLGLVVMFLSVIVDIVVSRHLHRVARMTDSLALEADGDHLSTDVYTSGGVLVGLALIRIGLLFGIEQAAILDPVIALLVSFLILRTAYRITRKSFGGLVDTRLPREEEETIRKSIMEHGRELVGFHALRTRKAGGERHIDLHLEMAKSVSLEEAHRICDHLEKDIEEKLSHTSVIIHCEPCHSECRQCAVMCAERDGSPGQAGPRP
ncbi:MAG: cation diffusion facilitator family transporter [Dehalococcoidia bacterium]|nr:cation diffusion facilitator family transporter [Dehalococcoidia bacterium]